MVHGHPEMMDLASQLDGGFDGTQGSTTNGSMVVFQNHPHGCGLWTKLMWKRLAPC